MEVFRHGRLRTDSAFYFIDMELCQANLEEYTLGKEVPGLACWTAAVAAKTHVRHLVDIMLQICDGLIFIHSHNEVHRDLNPQNGMSHILRTKSSSLFLQIRMLENRRFRPYFNGAYLPSQNNSTEPRKARLPCPRTPPISQIHV